MKSQAIGFLGSLVIAATVAAQGVAPPQQAAADQRQKGTEVSITGCVIQGSTPAIFIIDNAKVKPDDPNEKPVSYVLVAGTEDLMLKEHVNKEVRVQGEIERRTPPVAAPGQKVAEKDLLKFTTKGITLVADRCTAAGAVK